MRHDLQLLIIGAGPFGLALAAQAADDGIDCEIVGRPMEFWHSNMPAGMYLRSDADWHYDPAGVHTIERFLEEANLAPEDADPFPISLYLDYAEFPTLDERMQSSVPGLYFTSSCAIGDFGPFFGFTVAVQTSAGLIARVIRELTEYSVGPV